MNKPFLVDVETLPRQLVTKWGVGHAEFEDVTVWHRSQSMEGGRDGDAALEAVVDDTRVHSMGEPSDFDHRTDTAAAGVRLNPIEAAVAHEMAAATGLQIANYNASDQFVLGGDREAVAAGVAWGEARDVATVVLRVNGAFHTALFRPADRLSESLIAVLPVADRFTAMIGNAHGQHIATAADLRAELSMQYTRPIRWADALQTAYDAGVRTFVVTGPGNAMAGLVRRFGKTQPERLRFVRLNAPHRG